MNRELSFEYTVCLLGGAVLEGFDMTCLGVEVLVLAAGPVVDTVA